MGADMTGWHGNHRSPLLPMEKATLDDWVLIGQAGPIGYDGGACNDGGHAAFVDAWLERSAKDLPPAALVELLEAALNALWARTKTTLGEVTLSAIAERVLCNASEKFPLLSSLEVEATGAISFRALRERASAVHHSEVLEGGRFLVVEFLSVMGKLTAEILTPELHAELGSVARPDPSPPRERI